MTARKKAGQVGFTQEVERLMGYARDAEAQDNWGMAEVYYRRALALIDEDGLSPALRRAVEDALTRVRGRVA